MVLHADCRLAPGSLGLPEGTSAGVRCSRPVNLLDLFPTLLELCGLPEQSELDGHSLVPLLHEPETEWPHASLTHLGRPENYAISTERWRYIHYFRGGEELYDIETDPHEWTNLAAEPDYADRLEELRSLAPAEMTPKIENSTD